MKAIPKYKCCWCGREMLYKVSHNCNTGFRKHHLLFKELNKEIEHLYD